MNQPHGPKITGGRMQWGSYGFVAGIALGILMGWMFSGLVGAFMRVALVLLAVVPLVLAYIAWRKYVSPLLGRPERREYFEPMGSIETRGVVRGVVREPHPR